MNIPSSEFARAADLLRGARAVTLACHVGPDGDALGSMLACGLALRDLGIEVRASWGSEPFDVPKRYAFLPGLDLLVHPDAVDATPQVMATFDAGSIDRLGSLEASARAAGTLVVVDHHATNAGFGAIDLIDRVAAASAMIVHELLRHLGAELTPDIATCLYVGLVTDTGRFQYSNTTPDVHRVAAELLATGVPHVSIAQRLYESHPLGYLTVASVALQRMRVADGIAWTWVTTTDLVEAKVELEDLDALIDLVRTAEDAEVTFVLKQQEDGRYRVSMRSRGATNVGAISERFGGGGHALAAGFTADDDDPDRVASAVIGAIGPIGA